MSIRIGEQMTEKPKEYGIKLKAIVKAHSSDDAKKIIEDILTESGLWNEVDEVEELEED